MTNAANRIPITETRNEKSLIPPGTLQWRVCSKLRPAQARLLAGYPVSQCGGACAAPHRTRPQSWLFAGYQIGRIIVSLAKARELARKFLAQRILGKRDNPILHFEDAVSVFLESERIRSSTVRAYKRLRNTHFKPMLVTADLHPE
jgi:hypothetical protein